MKEKVDNNILTGEGRKKTDNENINNEA